jgi:hypothetical protein
MVVLVETVGDTAETAQAFEPANDRAFEDVAGTFHLGVDRARLPERLEYLINGFLEFLHPNAGLGRRLDREEAGDLPALLLQKVQGVGRVLSPREQRGNSHLTL